MSEESVAEILRFYQDYNQASETADVERGREQALKSLGAAHPEKVVEAAVEATRAAGRRDQAQLQIEIAGNLKRLKAEEAARTEELTRGLVEKQDAVRRRVGDAIETVRQAKGDLSPRFELLEERREVARKALQRISVQVGHRGLIGQFRRPYPYVLTGLAALEAPLNALAFSTFFEWNYWLALGIAAMAGAILMGFSHLTGTSVLQLLHGPTTRRRIVSAISATFLIGLAIVLVYIISELREVYLIIHSFAAGEIDVGDTLETAGTAIDVFQLIRSVFDLRLDGVGAALAIVNLLIFVFGASYSFIRHDPHPLYERAHVEARRADDRLVNYRQAAATEIALLREKANEELALIDGMAEQDTRGIKEIASRISSVEAGRDHFLALIESVAERRAQALRQGFYSALPTRALEASPR